jgi:hypothetical protein
VLEKRIEDLQRKIRNITNAIAEGNTLKSLIDQIKAFDKEILLLQARREMAEAEDAKTVVRSTRRFVEAGLRNLRALLNGEPQFVRAELAKHVPSIVLTPMDNKYSAVGDWYLQGLGAYDGAGGQNRTGYARLFRAALYQ